MFSFLTMSSEDMQHYTVPEDDIDMSDVPDDLMLSLLAEEILAREYWWCPALELDMRPTMRGWIRRTEPMMSVGHCAERWLMVGYASGNGDIVRFSKILREQGHAFRNAVSHAEIRPEWYNYHFVAPLIDMEQKLWGFLPFEGMLGHISWLEEAAFWRTVHGRRIYSIIGQFVRFRSPSWRALGVADFNFRCAGWWD